MFWFFDDFGFYGRAYENIARELSALPEVEKVVLVFPPRPEPSAEEGTLEVREISAKLLLLTELDPAAPRAAGLGRPKAKAALTGFFERHGFRRESTLAWYFPPHPYIDFLRDVVPACWTVSQIVDDFTQYDPGHFLHAFAAAQYARVPGWSDVVLTSATANFERFRSAQAPCCLFDLGVQRSFLAEPGRSPHQVRASSPRLGYVGWIMERTDLALLAALARRHPEWRLVLVGPEYPVGIVARSGLLEQPNVEWAGALRNDLVPAFLQTLDVCLIPHRDDAVSRSMSPLKLLQYLGSGRPIVATDVAGMERAAGHIAIAHDYGDFERKVAEALEFDAETGSAARIAVARAATWDLRTRQMFDHVTQELSGHDPGGCDRRGSRPAAT